MIALLAVPWTDAVAYRPFDSTDADVAADGEFELELGGGVLRQGSTKLLVAPAVVGNAGLAGERELVLQGERQVPQDASPAEARAVFVDTGLFVKQMLRTGAIQDEPGPSIATEYGFLLPEVHGQSGTGFSWAGILSQRWQGMTVSLNSTLSLTRTHHADLFLGAIVEGPYQWAVRPVAEVFADREASGPRINSVLVGAIWQVSKGLSLDIGVREAHSAGEPVREIRLGLTWGFPWKS